MPFLGLLVAVVAIYGIGLACTSLIGRFAIRFADRVLSRLPGLRHLYTSWKHVTVTPAGTGGVYANVVLIPSSAGHTLQMGFTSGVPVDGPPANPPAVPPDGRAVATAAPARSADPADDLLCVFVPAAPNPMNGQLYFVRRRECRIVDMSVEDTFKALLSTGNFLPPQVGPAGRSLLAVRDAEAGAVGV